MKPRHILMIDIDGLRRDVFEQGIQDGRFPNLARLLGGTRMERGLSLPALAPAPSSTFVSQACLFTGSHPREHGIAGNTFFDRFGSTNGGRPRHYAFDVGEMHSFDDAVLVFTNALASRSLQTKTIYERLPHLGRKSVVVGNMYPKGARKWLPPSILDMARFTKGGDLFGMSAEEYDAQLLRKALGWVDSNGMPALLAVHFLGLDSVSHADGPGAQSDYLANTLDPMVGELSQAVDDGVARSDGSVLTMIFSDHGQMQVPADDTHSLQMAFPFEREIGPFFDSLGLDVMDYPGEDPSSDAVLAPNGGLAHLYLRGPDNRWEAPPAFEEVVRVGSAFWDAHSTGMHVKDLEEALSGVFLRNVEKDGWNTPYVALTPGGEYQTLEEWFQAQPAHLYADPVNRFALAAGPQSGDIVLLSNQGEGFYFGGPTVGIHGGLHPEESSAVLAFGWPHASEDSWDATKSDIQEAIQSRCRQEGGREPSTADLFTGLNAVVGNR